jgi:hypothetical protein
MTAYIQGAPEVGSLFGVHNENARCAAVAALANRNRIGSRLFCPTLVVNHRPTDDRRRCPYRRGAAGKASPSSAQARSVSGSGVFSPRRPLGWALGCQAEQELLHDA